MSVATATFRLIEHVPAIGGLVDLEPGKRPAWLGDLPERCIKDSALLGSLVQSHIKNMQEGSARCVSLLTPFEVGVAEYGDLSIGAYLVTPDFTLRADRDLWERPDPQFLAKTLKLEGALESSTLEDFDHDGATGSAAPICGTLFPIPHGYWQSDYFSVGLPIPASYGLPATATVAVRNGAIELTAAGRVVSRTAVWNDVWTPPHPRGGTTRCGVATMLEADLLDGAPQRTGRRLAWFARMRVWKREADYGDFDLKQSRSLVME